MLKIETGVGQHSEEVIQTCTIVKGCIPNMKLERLKQNSRKKSTFSLLYLCCIIMYTTPRSINHVCSAVRNSALQTYQLIQK